MTALNVFANGLGVVTDDQLNTFEQTCDTFAQLRNFTGISGVQVFSRGQTAANDGYGGAFMWNAASTAADDNTNVIVPIGLTVGAWNRVAQSFITGTMTATNLTVSGTVDFTNALTVADGGTGVATLAPYAVLVGNGTGAIQVVSPGTAGTVLTSTGTASNPAFAALSPSPSFFTAVHDVTSSRTIGDPYVNTLDLPMFMSAVVQSTTTNVVIILSVAGLEVDSMSTTASGFGISVNGMVPSGNTYEVSGADFTLTKWTETW